MSFAVNLFASEWSLTTPHLSQLASFWGGLNQPVSGLILTKLKNTEKYTIHFNNKQL